MAVAVVVLHMMVHGVATAQPVRELVRKNPNDPFGLILGGVVGLRVSRLDSDIDDVEAASSFLFSTASVAVGTGDYFTAAGRSAVQIGGGEQGFELNAHLRLTGGVIGHFTRTNGMFIRGGLGGMYQRNDRHELWHVSLPLAEGGWQLHLAHFGIEVGARGGATLGGRFRIDPAGERSFGVVGRWGGFVTMATATNRLLALPGFWLNMEMARLELGRPINIGEVRACGGYIGVVCVDGRLAHADLPTSNTPGAPGPFEDAVMFYAGLTFGIGLAGATNRADGLDF